MQISKNNEYLLSILNNDNLTSLNLKKEKNINHSFMMLNKYKVKVNFLKI
jgi:hypothetical protein